MIIKPELTPKFITTSGLMALLLLVSIAGLSRLAALAQTPPSVSFTYQGRLMRSGHYLDNLNCDFRFSLFNAPGGGTQLGAVQSLANVPMRDGYFQVELNGGAEFGTDVFKGEQRYLQVSVRCPGDAGYTPITGRVELRAAPYAQRALESTVLGGVPWANVADKPAGFADGTDDVAYYTPGFGLTQNSNQFSVDASAVLNAISQTVQLRVTGSCTGNQSIQVINPDGTVVCAVPPNPYSAGDGVQLNNNTFSIDDTTVQRQVTGDCGSAGSGQAVRQIYQDGQVLCEDIPPGDITSITAGTGLTGGGSGPGSVTMSVGSSGIANSMLADNAVTAGKLADGAVGQSQLTGGAVTSAKIEDRSVSFADFGMSCASGQMMKWTGSDWDCGPNISHKLSGASGIVINNGVISIEAGEGIAVGSTLTVDYPSTDAEAGYSSRPTRSDHHHDLFYVKPETNLANKDVSGNKEDGLEVVGMQNYPVASFAPGPNQALRYVGGEWQPASYGFPFTIDVELVQATNSDSQGVVTVSCPADKQLVAGGCNCKVGTQIEDSFPPGSDSWYCNCAGSDSDYAAYALCLKTTYGSN